MSAGVQVARKQYVPCIVCTRGKSMAINRQACCVYQAHMCHKQCCNSLSQPCHFICRRLDCILLTYIEALTARPAAMPQTDVVQARVCLCACFICVCVELEAEVFQCSSLPALHNIRVCCALQSCCRHACWPCPHGSTGRLRLQAQICYWQTAAEVHACSCRPWRMRW